MEELIQLTTAIRGIAWPSCLAIGICWAVPKITQSILNYRLACRGIDVVAKDWKSIQPKTNRRRRQRVEKQ